MISSLKPVHAIPDKHGRVPPSAGINLREYAAIHIAQGLASLSDHTGMLMVDPRSCAQLAVDFADALIEKLQER